MSKAQWIIGLDKKVSKLTGYLIPSWNYTYAVSTHLLL